MTLLNFGPLVTLYPKSSRGVGTPQGVLSGRSRRTRNLARRRRQAAVGYGAARRPGQSRAADVLTVAHPKKRGQKLTQLVSRTLWMIPYRECY